MQTFKAGKSCNHHGFTLIELMVVMFLIAMTLGLVAPKIFTGLFSDASKDKTRMIAGLLAEARNKALTSGKSQFLVFDFERQSFWLRDEANATQEIIAYEDPGHVLDPILITDFQDSQGKKFSQGSVRIEFFPNGLVRPLLIHLTDQEDIRKTIRVKPFNHRLKVLNGFVYAEDVYAAELQGENDLFP